ncbi:MAG TPA: lipopolysaccharide heptosyltransferase II [Verrucomicrobiae bacterium]|nr:lipopolysaccharide heptosyltransferase II [Verrucomicrobiae bacterium]
MVRKHQPKRILVRCPNWVGDLIMATPVFACLRENFPEARISAMTRLYNAKVIADTPWLDEVVPCRDKTFAGLKATGQRIWEWSPDWIILLPNSIRSYIEARLGGSASELFGYRRGLRKFFVHGPTPQRDTRGYVPRPMVEYYLEICRWLGLRVPEHPAPRLFISEKLRQAGQRLLEQFGIADNDLVIGVNPGAKFGTSKCWPPEYFATLIDRLYEQHRCKLLLLVGPGEEELAATISAQTHAPLINTAPAQVDLGMLKPLIGRCGLLVTNDTGPRHYATAFQIPVVVIMGPTDPRYTASNLEQTIVLRKAMDCSPCHKERCSRNHECMRQITPDEVMHAVAKLLSQVVAPLNLPSGSSLSAHP